MGITSWIFCFTEKEIKPEKSSGFLNWLSEVKTGPAPEPGSLVLLNTNAKHNDIVGSVI